jgi:hypothetical protein
MGGRKGIISTKLIRVPIDLIDRVDREYPTNEAVGQKLLRFMDSQEKLREIAEMLAEKCDLEPGLSRDEVIVRYIATVEVRMQQLEAEIIRYRAMFEGLLIFFQEAGMDEIANKIEEKKEVKEP